MGWLSDMFSSSSEQRVEPKKMDINQRRVYDDLNEYMFGTSDVQGERFDPEYYLRNNPEVARGLGINVNRPLTAKDLKRVEKYHNQYKDFDPFYYIKQNPEIAAELGITADDLVPDGTKEGHDRSQDARKKLKNHYKKVGQYQGLQANDYQTYDPNAAPIASYQDRFAEDFGYTQGANQDYLNSVLGANNQYSGVLQSMADRNARISDTPMQITGAGLSGPMSFTSGTQRRAEDNAANYLSAINQLAKENAQAQNIYDTTYTPNALDNAWMGILAGQDADNFQKRMALGTTEITSTPSAADALTGIISALTGVVSGGANIANASNTPTGAASAGGGGYNTPSGFVLGS
jgi:hypothetical protein